MGTFLSGMARADNDPHRGGSDGVPTITSQPEALEARRVHIVRPIGSCRRGRLADYSLIGRNQGWGSSRRGLRHRAAVDKRQVQHLEMT